MEINSVVLSNNDQTLFRLEKADLAKSIGFLSSISKVGKSSATFGLDTYKKPFDPYIVFDPINELISPIWKRTLLLVLPWLVLFFYPVLQWLRRIKREAQYLLFFVALFIAVIPLKIAWVSFTTLLLLVYALFQFYQKRELRIVPNHLAITFFFIRIACR